MGCILSERSHAIDTYRREFEPNKYIKILQEKLLPFSEKYHRSKQNLICQQVCCVSHRAKAVSYFLEAAGIVLPQGPAQCPDLNSIENASAVVKRELRRSSTYPTSKDALFIRLSEIWDSIPTSYLGKLLLPCTVE